LGLEHSEEVVEALSIYADGTHHPGEGGGLGAEFVYVEGEGLDEEANGVEEV
jgi:hypothetical protein